MSPRGALVKPRAAGQSPPDRFYLLMPTPVPAAMSVLLALTLAPGPVCVFTPPPPLPEEIAAMEAAAEARKAAVRTGAPDPVNGPGGVEEEQGELGSVVFKKGDEAPRGMNLAQIKAYNAAQGDPEESDWTMEEALAGLPGQGDALVAQFKTSRGVLECDLYAQEAPKTVANFVGLARGVRPSIDRNADKWEKKPYYNGTTFHRVIPGFMIQGGDPTGTGLGNPGYVIEDEIRPDLLHDGAGVLSMANKGPNTGSAQFFITLNPTPHLDGKHTVFGRCNEEAQRMADDIALVPRDANDKPNDPEVIESVTIVRRVRKAGPVSGQAGS